jgi:S-adenosylmethionine/arginine decarboxylase-like enzyme
MVIIAESHISVHTFPEHKRFHLDVFSCKPFDPEATVRIVERRLGVTRRAADVIRRPALGDEVAAAGERHWRLQTLAEAPAAPAALPELVGAGR